MFSACKFSSLFSGLLSDENAFNHSYIRHTHHREIACRFPFNFISILSFLFILAKAEHNHFWLPVSGTNQRVHNLVLTPV